MFYGNLGVENADYGQRFVSGLWRYGVNKDMTLETRGEFGRDTQGAVAGVVRALPLGLLGQLAVAFSRDRSAGRGHQYLLGLEYNNLRHGFTLRSEGASRGFRQIGTDDSSLAYQRQLSGSYTYASEGFGALGLGFARIYSFEQGLLTTYSANYSMRLGERASLTFNAVRVNGSNSSNSAVLGATSFGVNLLLPLERQLSLSSSVLHRSGQTDAYLSASQG